MRKSMRALAGAATVMALLLAAPSPAPAHEHREIGRFSFTVGWGTEPAYSGFQNTAQVVIEERATEKPVVAGVSLQVEIAHTSEKKTYPLEPGFVVGVFGREGEYRVPLVPTRPGEYSFRLFGTVRGQRLNATFACGEKTFDCITDQAEVHFPARDPSAAALNERLDREVDRVASVADTADDDAGTAKALAIAGLAAGVLALVLAGLGIRKRSTTR